MLSSPVRPGGKQPRQTRARWGCCLLGKIALLFPKLQPTPTSFIPAIYWWHFIFWCELSWEPWVCHLSAFTQCCVVSTVFLTLLHMFAFKGRAAGRRTLPYYLDRTAFVKDNRVALTCCLKSSLMHRHTWDCVGTHQPQRLRIQSVGGVSKH